MRSTARTITVANAVEASKSIALFAGALDHPILLTPNNPLIELNNAEIAKTVRIAVQKPISSGLDMRHKSALIP